MDKKSFHVREGGKKRADKEQKRGTLIKAFFFGVLIQIENRKEHSQRAKYFFIENRFRRQIKSRKWLIWGNAFLSIENRD